MFTPFNKNKLEEIIQNTNIIANNSNKNHPNKLNFKFNIFKNISTSCKITFKKFEESFVFTNFYHYINLNEFNNNMNNYLNDDYHYIINELKNDILNSDFYKKYKLNNNNLKLPCLTNINEYCSLCNLIQVMNFISNYDLDNDLINDKSKYFDILENMQNIALFFRNTFYKFNNFYLPCVYSDNNTTELTIFNIDNKSLQEIINKIIKYLKENGILLSEVEFITIKLNAYFHEYDIFIDDINIFINDDTLLTEDEKILFNELNKINKDKLSNFLYNKIIINTTNIEELFNIIDKYIENIIEKIKEELTMVS